MPRKYDPLARRSGEPPSSFTTFEYDASRPAVRGPRPPPDAERGTRIREELIRFGVIRPAQEDE
jgi:hypothetical protein